MSVRAFRDRLSGGWASGIWSRTSVRRVHPVPTIPIRSSTHDALVIKFMDEKLKTVGKVDLGASPEAEG